MNLDKKYIKITHYLQKKIQGTTFPNPAVFALIVESDKKFNSNKIVSFGFTKFTGRPHAEAVAISGIKFFPNKIYSLYSTLEPCCHKGRGESCVEKILKSRISRVIFSIKDPDQRINGKGMSILKKNGLEVKFNILSNEIKKMYKGYIYNRTLQRPKVTIKVGCSLDSKISLKQGQRDSITNKLVQKIVHNYRAEYDAILVGGNTVKIDNPKLNCRTKGLEDLSPYRIILSKSLDFDFNSEILKKKNEKLTIIFTLESNKRKNSRIKSKCLKIITLKKKNYTLSNILYELAKFGICNLLVEGGTKIFTSFLKENIVDQIIIFRSNTFIGPDGQDFLSKNYKPNNNSFSQICFRNVGDNSIQVLEKKD